MKKDELKLLINKISQDPKKAIIISMDKLGIFKLYNLLIDVKKRKTTRQTDLKELNEIIEFSHKRTAINDHLVTIFFESIGVSPKLIVELGVRSGNSTFVLERVAKLFGSRMISVDIEDCLYRSSYGAWTFVRRDDIDFAREFQKTYMYQEPCIDVLYIDTNHEFEHTCREIDAWFPLLSKKAKVFFHDTNMTSLFLRKDRSVGIGWNNKRGVMRAIERYFDKSFEEKKDFNDFCNGWLIKHHSFCNGLTILEKVNGIYGK